MSDNDPTRGIEPEVVEQYTEVIEKCRLDLAEAATIEEAIVSAS